MKYLIAIIVIIILVTGSIIYFNINKPKKNKNISKLNVIDNISKQKIDSFELSIKKRDLKFDSLKNIIDNHKEKIQTLNNNKNVKTKYIMSSNDSSIVRIFTELQDKLNTKAGNK